ncbi:hypothetical protein Bca101_048033 [Brassica carinata]
MKKLIPKGQTKHYREPRWRAHDTGKCNNAERCHRRLGEPEDKLKSPTINANRRLREPKNRSIYWAHEAHRGHHLQQCPVLDMITGKEIEQGETKASEDDTQSSKKHDSALGGSIAEEKPDNSMARRNSENKREQVKSPPPLKNISAGFGRESLVSNPHAACKHQI